MKKMKKAIAALLALILCLSVLLPYTGKTLASDVRAEEDVSADVGHTVTLLSSEGGRVRFIDSEEQRKVWKGEIR